MTLLIFTKSDRYCGNTDDPETPAFFTMDDTTVVASRSSVVSSSDPSDGSSENHHNRQVDPDEVAQPFLSLFSLLQSIPHLPLKPELMPVHWSKTIGEGLSFTVKEFTYRGHGRDIQRARKISRLQFEKNSNSEPTALNSRRLKDLAMELYVLSHKPLMGHDNIIQLLGFGWTTDPWVESGVCPVLELELSQHRTLTAFLDSSVKLDYAHKLHLCYDIGQGLDALHKCGIVHGDVKSDNVLVFDSVKYGYIAKVADFGNAVITTPVQGEIDEDPLMRIGGTPAWQAPEASGPIRRSKLHLTDVYSFGLLIWKTFLDGRDLFAVFDLPSDPGLRHYKIQQVMRLDAPLLMATVLITLEAICGEIEEQLKNTLSLLILLTMDNQPERRDLSKALEITAMMFGEEFRPIEGSKLLLEQLDLSLKIKMEPHILLTFNPLIQRKYFLALEEVGVSTRKALTTVSSPERKAKLENLLFECHWSIIKCCLLGIGGEVNPKKAIDILLDITESGDKLGVFASSILATFGTAFYENPPPAIERKFAQNGVLAAACGSATALNWVKQTMPDILQTQGFQHTQSQFLAQVHGFVSNICLEFTADTKLIEKLIQDGEGHGGRRSIHLANLGKGNRLIHAVALTGKLDAIRILVEKSEQDEIANSNGKNWLVDLPNDAGETPLLLACMRGHRDAALYLIARGANAAIPRKKDNDTCLHWLCAFDGGAMKEIARGLVKQNNDIHSRAGPRGTNLFPMGYMDAQTVFGNPLERAVGKNSLPAANALLELLNIDEDVPTWQTYLETSLVIASSLHLYDVLKALLTQLFNIGLKEGAWTESKGVGQSWQAKGLRSLLYWAIPATREVERICVHGADFKKATALTLDILGIFGFMTSIMSCGTLGLMRVLNYAVTMGSPTVIHYLLENTIIKEDVNSVEPNTGFTPIHDALRRRNKEMFTLLIKHGAHIDLRGRYNPQDCLAATKMNYLHVCATYHLEDLFFAQAIVDEGVPVDIPDSNDVTPLHLAIIRRCFNLARFLMQHGASINKINSRGETMMGALLCDMYANNYENAVQSIEFVIGLTDPYETPKFIVHEGRKETILHCAAACRSLGMQSPAVMTSLLSRYNSNEHLEAKTVRGGTALQVAIAAANLPAINTLLEAGADIDVLCPEGHTTLELAHDFVPKSDIADLYVSPDRLRRKIDDSATRRALQVVAAIEGAKQWPDRVYPGDIGRRTLAKLYQQLAPHLKVLESVSHEESKRLNLQKIITEIIADVQNPIFDRVQDWNTAMKVAYATSVQTNRIINPWFFMSVELEFHRLDRGFNLQLDSDARSNIVESGPAWLQKLNRIQFRALQQAAIFEFLLQDIHRFQQEHPDGDVEEVFRGSNNAIVLIKSFSRYATTMKGQDLPIPPSMIFYPSSLATFYMSSISAGGCLQDVSNDEMLEILTFARISILRKEARRANSQVSTPLSAEQVKVKDNVKGGKHAQSFRPGDNEEISNHNNGESVSTEGPLTPIPITGTPPSAPQPTESNSPSTVNDNVFTHLPITKEQELKFNKFHFEQLHSHPLSLTSLTMMPANTVKCSCNRDAVEKINLDYLIEAMNGAQIDNGKGPRREKVPIVGGWVTTDDSKKK